MVFPLLQGKGIQKYPLVFADMRVADTINLDRSSGALAQIPHKAVEIGSRVTGAELGEDGFDPIRDPPMMAMPDNSGAHAPEQGVFQLEQFRATSAVRLFHHHDSSGRRALIAAGTEA
jgi:hypothetical protein